MTVSEGERLREDTPHTDMNKQALKPGTRLRDKYVIGTSLGSGGFGITYIGFDTVLEHQVAIKEFFPASKAERNADGLGVECDDREDFDIKIENFKKEAALIFGSFDLPGICPVLDFFTENGTAYIVMEYLSGGTLKQYLSDSGRLSFEECLLLFAPVLEGLCHLHAMGIVHRDISPDNLMLDSGGKLRLIDFGASAVENALKEDYAAPEQFGRPDDTGPWSDIFSICAVMYEALTGQRPPSALSRLNSKTPLKRISAETDIVQEAERAILKGLSISPSGRYFNCGSLMKGIGLDTNAIDSLLPKTRTVWGDEWLRIITETENLDTENSRLLSASALRKIKKISLRTALVFLAVILVSAVFINTHPAAWLKMRARISSRSLGKSYLTYYTHDTKEYERIMKVLKEKNESASDPKSYMHASITMEEYRKLGIESYSSHDSLPVKLPLAKDIFAYSFEQNLGRGLDSYESASLYFSGTEDVCYATTYASKYFNYTGSDGKEHEVKIAYDPNNKRVSQVQVEGSLEDARTTLKKALPLIVPETYLTDEEISSLMQETENARKNKTLKKRKDMLLSDEKGRIKTEFSIKNNPRYKLYGYAYTYSDSQEVRLVICRRI